MSKEIKGFFKEYRWLSNFWLTPVVYDGRIYPSSENAYQAAKFLNMPEEFYDNLVRCTPGQAKRIGRKGDLRVGWDTIKFKIMKEILIAKFDGNVELKQKLLDTGDAYLEETNHWGDQIWGVCNGEGENHLGKLLMEIREEFNAKVE